MKAGFSPTFKFGLMVAAFLALAACGKLTTSKPDSGCSGTVIPGTDGHISPDYTCGPSEIPYYGTAMAISGDTVTISGTATYQPRVPDTNGMGAQASKRAIRMADIEVFNSAGDVVQATETDMDGNYSLLLPKGNGTFTIDVFSRADNSSLKASVLDRPERNDLYKLSATITADSDQTVDFNATATGDILAAPFNILDRLLDANEYLRDTSSNGGNCSGKITGCTAFTVAPKVSVYWEKGFNPNDYFGGLGGLSFYLPGYHRLFILGGIDGDVDSSDTDHFDDSVIIHEYGHFMEDVFSKSDSPGGSHSGNAIVDPRLAWSEGWGDFFQAAVQNYADSSYVPQYIDTYGTPDGTTGYFFKIDLETPDAICTTEPTTPGCDVPTDAGEGNFREFAITRFLWDVIDDPTSDDDSIAGGGFPDIWAALTSTSGYLDSNAAFRNIGLLHLAQESETGSSAQDWSTLRTSEKQEGSLRDYAQYVVGDSTTCNTSNNFSITPKYESGDDGDFDTSDLFHNNDFYHYKHAGGPLTLTLNYQTESGSNHEADLDLYLYKPPARFGVASDVVGFSQQQSDDNKSTSESEQISISDLPAGDYLIDVMVYTGSFTSTYTADKTDYEILDTSGERLCPKTLP